MEAAKKQPQRLTPTDQMRARFKGLLDRTGGFLNRLGLMPNTVTIMGLVGNTAGAVLIGLGHMTWGGVLVLLMGPLDALDGTMARLRGMDGKFGAFVDSVTDRYSELIIFGGLLYYYIAEQNWLAALTVYAAAAGSVLVSYIRSRGQSLGWDTKIGILSRMERYLILAPALLLDHYLWGIDLPIIAVSIIAIFANITALQRILDVRRQAHHP